jgi:Short C-terminal domain
MTKKTFQDKNRDLDILSKDIQSWFAEQGYEVQSNKAEGAWVVQAQKKEAWRKVVGASRAFNILMQGQSNNFSVEVGTGEWASNLLAGGVTAIFTGGLTFISSGLAAGWSKKIEGDIWDFIEQKIIFGEKAKSQTEIVALKTQESVEDKLKKLQDVFEQGLIDEVAYHAKRRDLENQKLDQKNNHQLNEKLMKLKSALDAGILSQTEYETKKTELVAQSSNAELDSKLSQLKAALATGIITQEEFEKKAAVLHNEINFAEKLKQLENAKNSGIISNEEFEHKKTQMFAVSI